MFGQCFVYSYCLNTIYIHIYIYHSATFALEYILVLVQATYYKYIVLNCQCHIADAIRISHTCRVVYSTAIYRWRSELCRLKRLRVGSSIDVACLLQREQKPNSRLGSNAIATLQFRLWDDSQSVYWNKILYFPFPTVFHSVYWQKATRK